MTALLVHRDGIANRHAGTEAPGTLAAMRGQKASIGDDLHMTTAVRTVEQVTISHAHILTRKLQ